MVVSYTGRRLEITDEIKDYIEKRMKKFKFYYEQIIKIDVVMETERGKYEIEVKVGASGDSYFAKSTAPTWQEVVDDVTDKIEKEIKKKKDKLKDHNNKTAKDME